MIYFEYWDKNDRQWYLSRIVWYKFLYMKFILWFYGKNNFSVSDIKRIPLNEIEIDD